MNRKLLGAVLSAGVALGGGALVVVPAWAVPSTPQACALFANTPQGSISGRGGRSGCSNPASYEVVVNKDVSFRPDPTAARATGSGNSSVTARGDCRFGRGSYFTETRSSTGNKLQSARVTRC